MRLLVGVGAALMLFGSALSSTVQAQDAPVLATITDPAEKERVQGLIEEARKEGKLEWTGVFIEPKHAQVMLDEFKRYYGLPDLETEYSYGSSGDVLSRVNGLVKAKQNNFDIVWMVAWGWYSDLVEQGEVLEYNSPFYEEYTISNDGGLSKDGYWVSDSYAQVPMYNPATMEKHGLGDFEITKWSDLTDPRLKGKLAGPDMQTSVSNIQTFIGVTKKTGEDWISGIGANGPAVWQKSAQGRDWVASGEYPIAITSHAKNATTLLNADVDVKLVYPEEGTVLLPFAPIILAQAPHPATAKLFIDFARSAHGTQTLMDAGALLFFGRPGVVSPVPDLLPPTEELTLIKVDWDEDITNDALQNLRDIAEESGW